jgi:hypothetical protein
MVQQGGFVAPAPRLRNGIALQGDTPAKARGGVIAGYGDDEQRNSAPVTRRNKSGNYAVHVPWMESESIQDKKARNNLRFFFRV